MVDAEGDGAESIFGLDSKLGDGGRLRAGDKDGLRICPLGLREFPLTGALLVSRLIDDRTARPVAIQPIDSASCWAALNASFHVRITSSIGGDGDGNPASVQ